MASTLQEILDKLPDDVRPLVDKWVNLVTNLTTEEVMAMSTYLLSGDQLSAYELAVSKMTGAELVLAMKETNARIKAHTGKVLSQASLQKEIMLEIIRVLWGIAILWVQKETIPPPPA